MTNLGGTFSLEGSYNCSEARKTYQVGRLVKPMVINADWNKPQWRRVEPLDIRLFMGAKPDHLPKTQAKVLYDEEYVYVIFRVKDKYIRAVETERHGRVWEDSCVEFFLTPGTDISNGYFNIETNCIGTLLLHYQPRPDEDIRPLKPAECDRLEIATSLPKKVIDPEITEPLTWTLEYRVPVEMFGEYRQVVKPAPGVKWRANFYKCAETVSYPHWLTWSLVVNDVPNFHLPEYFGTLEFVD
jgi:hypothetical protein